METKKSKKADLEPKKSTFLQLGLIVSLLLVFMAFEWKSYDYEVITITDLPVSAETIEDLPPITKEPELPKTPIPLAISFEIVDQPIEDDPIIFDPEIGQDEPIPPYVPKPSAPQEQYVDPDEPFIIVEQMPQFPGGEGELLKFLSRNITYPQIAREANIQGNVYAQFVIEKNGKVSGVKILRGIGGGCDEEAMRVLRMMPDWSPGRQRGIPVRVAFNIPVSFKLN